MPDRHRSRRWVTVAATAAALGLVLGSCGGGSDSGGDGDAGRFTDVTIAASGPPRSGGTLEFGIEAESDGFNPARSRWAVSGMMVANAVYDPLAAYDAEGTAQPYLAKSFTPSADFTTWVIELRPGITFTNGEPLDGAAVKKNLDAIRASVLTGAAAANLASTEVDPADPMKVIVTMNDPWASFPSVLTGQVGMVAAPAQLDADGEAATREPIGTGPFMQQEWVPDNRWVGVRNPDYWRTDASGTQLPYLDSVVMRPIVDAQDRTNALISGDVQMLHTTDWSSIARLQSEADAGDLQLVIDPTESEESHILINTSAAPLDDVRVRRAMALCTDAAQVRAVAQVPEAYAATSQFKEDSPWFSESGFPTYDPEAGSALVREVEAEAGDIGFTLASAPLPTSTAITQVLAQQWGQCGLDVDIVTLDQSTQVLDVASGNFQAMLSRQFGASDPDQEYHWWRGEDDWGPLSPNFARLNDRQINAALERERASSDPAVRREALAEVVRRQSELVPYIWLYHAQWAIAGANEVRNPTNVSLPDGEPSLPFQSGNMRLTETWLEDR